MINMALGRDVAVAGVLLTTCAVFYFIGADGAGLLQFAARALLGLAALVFILHQLEPHLRRLFTRIRKLSKTPTADQYTSLTPSEVVRRQKESRERSQELHAHKASSYTERILQPREEARQRRREEDFHQFAGPAWKGQGTKLGGEGSRTTKDGSGRTAAAARILPPVLETPVTSTPLSTPTQKKKLHLPDEPPEGSTSCVCVVFRTPQGTTYKRRFFTADTVQVLLDYMTLLGYHETLYTLSTSYPRRSLSYQVHSTLLELGLDRDTALNVEPREQEV